MKVGASSKDIRQAITFELSKELVVKQVNKALTPQREILVPFSLDLGPR